MGIKDLLTYPNFKIINKVQFLKLPNFFYIGNRKITRSKQTTAPVEMLTASYSKSLISHHLYTAPVNSAGSSKLQDKAAFSRQSCLTMAPQFLLFRWGSGNRCICLCLRLKPLCPDYTRYHNPFITGYKKASVLQWYREGKSLEELKYLRKGTNSFSDISLTLWTVFTFFFY